MHTFPATTLEPEPNGRSNHSRIAYDPTRQHEWIGNAMIVVGSLIQQDMMAVDLRTTEGVTALTNALNLTASALSTLFGEIEITQSPFSW
jgi:hypothetical protein